MNKQEDTISQKSEFNQVFPNKYNNSKKWTGSMMNGLIRHDEKLSRKAGTDVKGRARYLRNGIARLSFFTHERVRHKLPLHQTRQYFIAFQL